MFRTSSTNLWNFVLLLADILFFLEFLPVLLVVLSDEMAIVFENFDGFPGGFFRREIFPSGEVEYLSTKNSTANDFLNFEVSHINIISFISIKKQVDILFKSPTWIPRPPLSAHVSIAALHCGTSASASSVLLDRFFPYPFDILRVDPPKLYIFWIVLLRLFLPRVPIAGDERPIISFFTSFPK